MKRTLTFLALLAAGAQLGCSDDVAPHGVSPDRELDTLDQDEIDAICVDAYTRPGEAALPTTREYCTVDALVRTALGGGSEPVCDAYLDECLAEPPSDIPTEIDPVDTSMCPTVAALAGCGLTVGEVDACTAARVEAIDDAWNQVTCSELDSASALDDLDLAALPECQHLTDTCPGLL